MLKSEVRSLSRVFLDDPDKVHWTDANLDVVIGLVYDEFWEELLDAESWLTSSLETLTSLTSPGYINTASGGDLTNRFFRLQKLTRDEQVYGKSDARDVVIEDNEVVIGRDYTYMAVGDLIYLLPFDTTTDVEIRYSYLPEAFGDLSDNENITWPTKSSLCLAMMSAGVAMMKGDREDPSKLVSEGRRRFEKVLRSVQRMDLGPETVWLNDDSLEWGSVT